LSLNWREIDAVLEELSLDNALIRDIYQPSHPQLVFELFKPARRLPGGGFKVLFSFANPTCRLHLLSPEYEPGKPRKAQRFVSFLRAHVRGGRILSAVQVDGQRIVRIEIKKAEHIVVLWCRLWAAAANLIATDPGGVILDALYRRPKRGEISGATYSVENDITAGSSRTRKDDFRVRELPGPGNFNSRIEAHYFHLERERESARLRSSLLSRLQREENRLLAANQNLEKKRSRYGEPENLKQWGDLILSNIHTLKRGDRWLTVTDDTNPDKTWDIELDPQASPAQNAESYYRRYRKAKSGLKSLDEERRQNRRQLDVLKRHLENVENLSLESLRQELNKGRRNQRQVDQTPGLTFTSGAFSILVGRNVRENDALLRRFVRGNDTWLHARDYPGGYVFIRSLAGRSVPLDTLLDAANLALHYSRAKGSGSGDVFYTKVKHLKRVKDAKTGLVIPTQEKNLHVKLDPARIRRLQQSSSY
jgi:predicted ribosome quality control (RQC) complex YloA/Tae2 family protein